MNARAVLSWLLLAVPKDCILVNWERAEGVGREVVAALHSLFSNEGGSGQIDPLQESQSGHLLPLQVTSWYSDKECSGPEGKSESLAFLKSLVLGTCVHPGVIL